MPVYLGSQSPVSLPTCQQQFLLSEPPNIVVPTFFLHLVAMLGVPFQYAAVKRLQWSLRHPANSDIRNAPFPSDQHVAWARFAHINIISNHLEHQIAARAQSFDEKLYRIDIERVRLVNYRPFRAAFVPNQQGVC